MKITPNGTTLIIAQLENRALPGERSNKSPLYVSRVRKTRKFLEWIRAKTASELLAQMKRENLVLVSETANGFRATIGARPSLGEGKRVSFTPSLCRRTDVYVYC
jgi:hypothetical protein